MSKSIVSKSNRKILFGLTGSIAAFKACELISALVKDGNQVRTVTSPSAQRFVGDATLEGLTGESVFSSVFESGKMMDHIQLARWSDAWVICPATANKINELANGVGGDAISSLFLAYELEKKPVWIAPAMNHQMWNHPATRRSVQVLQSWGVRFLGPAEGDLACGELGVGRLMEPQRMFEILKGSLDESLSHVGPDARAH